MQERPGQLQSQEVNAMRVIRFGHIRPKRIHCFGCGAELEYYAADVKRFNGQAYITCPLCKRSIRLEESRK